MALTTMYAAQTNSPTTTLASAAGAADTSLIVTSAAVLPSTTPFELSLGIGEAAAETVLVTAVNGNTLTVTRGWDGTPQAWAANTVCARTFSARDLNDMQANIAALGSTLDSIVDNTLSVSGKAADAAVTGTALYQAKTRNDNVAAGLTYWRYSVSHSSGFTPADIPLNCFTEATGDKLNGFGDFTFSSSATYLVWCWGNSANTSIRNYFVMQRTGKRFIFGRTINSGSTVSWTDWTAPAPDTTLSESGIPADAATVGSAIYGTKVRADNTPARLTWWKVADLFDATTPASPTDMPVNTYTYTLGSWIAGFNNSVFTLTAGRSYFVYCWANLKNPDIRFYQIYSPTRRQFFVGQTSNGGSTITWADWSPQTPRTPNIMFLGDSITRGRLGGQSANAATPIPDWVAKEMGVGCENFGIGDIGWCTGYSSSTTYGYAKDNALAYLKRVGNDNYYSSSSPYNGYKFLGSGNWSDFNAIVIALGANDVAVPLGDWTAIASYDALTYAEVMAWNTGHGGSDRTILKAMYQVYRYIRESETAYNSGTYTYVNQNTYVIDADEYTTPVYVPGGSKLPIIICDPIVSGGAGSAPSWTYPVIRSGGYTKLEMCEMYANFAERYGLGHISCFDAPLDRLVLTNSLPDGTHPNEATYAALGRFFAGKISGLIL